MSATVNSIRKPINLRLFFYRWKTVIFGFVIIQILLLIFIKLNSQNQVFSFINAVSYPKYNVTELQKIEIAKKCFLPAQSYDGIVLLPDILEHEVKPTPDKSIFFHVTTCQSNGSVILNARQACAIESAAKWNPHRDIFVLFAAPVGLIPNEIVSPFLNALQSYPNIYFRNLDINNYSIGTPGETWIKTDRIYLSKFIVAHMSDYLRFLTLYKFGGIYFDLDLIILKNLDNMPPNFIGAEDWTWTGDCVLGFDSGYAGHKMVEMISRENIENYKPQEWGSSGVGAATRMVHKICRSDFVLEAKPEHCWGLKIYPQSAFIPIHWSKNDYLFSSDPKIMNESLAAAKDSITVHAWNNLNSDIIIDKSKPKTVYATFAEMNCPTVYGSSGQYF